MIIYNYVNNENSGEIHQTLKYSKTSVHKQFCLQTIQFENKALAKFCFSSITPHGCQTWEGSSSPTYTHTNRDIFPKIKFVNRGTICKIRLKLWIYFYIINLEMLWLSRSWKIYFPKIEFWVRMPYYFHLVSKGGKFKWREEELLVFVFLIQDHSSVFIIYMTDSVIHGMITASSCCPLGMWTEYREPKWVLLCK